MRDVDELAGLLTAMRGAAARDDGAGVAEADARFHARIVELADNGTLSRVWSSLEPLSRTYLTLIGPGADLHWSAELHAPILDALRARDTDADGRRPGRALRRGPRRDGPALAGGCPDAVASPDDRGREGRHRPARQRLIDAPVLVRAADQPGRRDRPARRARRRCATAGRWHRPHHPAARPDAGARAGRRRQAHRRAGRRHPARPRRADHRGTDDDDDDRRRPGDPARSPRAGRGGRGRRARSRSGTGPRWPATSATPLRRPTRSRRCSSTTRSSSSPDRLASAASRSTRSSSDPA